VYYTYSHADEYTAGAGTVSGKVDRMEVQWLQGEVQILPAAEGTEGIVLEESGSLPINQNTSVHYLLDGTTLRVRFAKSGGFVTMVSKTLKIYIPNKLLSLEVNSTAADIRLGAITVDDCSISVASGNVRVDGVVTNRHFAFEAASGSLTGHADCSGSEMELDVATGSIDFSPTSCRNFDVIAGSGDVTIVLEETPNSGSFDVASGDMTVYLPVDANFTLALEVILGKFTTDFENTKEGNYYTIGEGTSRFDVRAASGNVKIYKK
jgi:DUF4097 and DUF4098 domain-containing protein YvlB